MPNAAPGGSNNKLVIKNIGTLLSGKLEQPILDADTIVVRDGIIAEVGRQSDCDLGNASVTVDARGSGLCPGLIDDHVHPSFGDWDPRQSQSGWIESNVHGGVTTLISAGEVHVPGRPKDIVGVKALAIAAQRAYRNYRPLGMKILAGAPIFELGIEEADIAELAKAGIHLSGEIGLGTVQTGPEARKVVTWARKHGIRTTIHTGGASIPGSGYISKDVVLESDADIIAHINGGTTSIPERDIRELCERSPRAMEIVHNGNERMALATAGMARESGCAHRVLLGTDAPAGSGVQPLGILRLITLLSSVGGCPPEVAFCFATGNAARIQELNTGCVEVGRAADFVLLDHAENSAGKTLLESVSLGDIPGIGMVIIDGVVRIRRSRNTPPAQRFPEIVDGRA